MDLFGPDELGGPAVTAPGRACVDAPVGNGYLLDHLTGFTLLSIGTEAETSMDQVHIADPSPELRARYLEEAGQAVYLIRPDQHVAARWPAFDATEVEAAMQKALGKC